jgi:hypothetical protein
MAGSRSLPAGRSVIDTNTMEFTANGNEASWAVA